MTEDDMRRLQLGVGGIMAIYFVRHGKDEDGYRGGWSQRGLIKEGIQQAKMLGEFLKENQASFKIHRIITSDLKRAVETATYIGDALQLPIEKSKDWRETNNGILAGMPNDEANKRFPGLYFNRLKMNELYPCGESPIENFTRIKRTFENLCEDLCQHNCQDNILVVTHGGVINIIYHILERKEWTNKSSFFPVTHTSIHKVEYVKGNWEMVDENLARHLEN